MNIPAFADIEAAAARLRGHAIRTPLLRSAQLDAITGARVFVKAECLQLTGSFKFRGAFNTASALPQDQRGGGLVACSSGNHAQGVAEAARLLGMKSVIVMPSDAPAIKVARTRRSGAEVVLYDRNTEDRDAIAREIVQRTGAHFVHPYENPFVIAGQGTCGLEIAEDLAAMGLAADRVISCCGGGGLTAGTALAIHARFPDAKVHTAEPAGFDDYARSLAQGARVGNVALSGSACDALLTPMPGETSFAINKDHVASGFAVTDAQAFEAMRIAFAELKIVVEPGGAVALAALLSQGQAFTGETVVCIASGGNVDPEFYAGILEKAGLTQAISDVHAEKPPYAFAVRMALLYSVVFSAAGLVLPYLPLWLKDRGLDSTQIALVISLPLAVRVLTSGYVSAYADRVRERADVVIVLMAGAAISFALYPLFTDFWAILAVSLVVAFFSHPLQPVMDSITLSGVRRFGHDYGKIRLWGSVIFIFANIGGGWLLGAYGTQALMAAMVVTAFLGLAFAPITPRLGRPRQPANLNQLAGATTWKLMANRRFLLVTAGCGIVQATHAMVYGFGSIYWESAGYSGSVIGIFWAIGVAAEIALFQFSRQIFRKVTPVQLALLGGFAALVRWTLFPLEPGLAGFVVLQILHGLSFGATHLGLMHFYNDAVPEERMGSAQAAGFVTGAIAMGTFGLMSGPLYEAFGVNAFLAMGLAGGTGFLLLLMGGRVKAA